MSIESRVHGLLANSPILKKIIKRAYQFTSVVIFRPKKSEGKIKRVTPKDEYEYLFGYYDKSPWDSSNKKILCLRVKNASKEVAPKEAAEIVLIDTENNNLPRVIAETRTWNVQQGCMLGWLGPKFDTEIFYNDYRDDRYCGVIKNIETGSEKIFEMPFYSVSSDGKTALSLDFSRLHRLRPGYGYSNLKDMTKSERLPNGACVWKIDLETNKIEPVLKYKQLYNFEHRQDMEGADHKVNHLMLSPNGKRFMVIHRWLKGGKKISRLLTCDIDGKNLYNLLDDDMVSHCCWKNDSEILAYCRKDGVNGYYLMKDKSDKFEKKWEFLTADGHPSYSPDSGLVVTDTYPNRNRISTIRILSDAASTIVAKVYSPFKYDNNTRCDLHPRWSRDGKMICFDGCFEGKREMYVVEAEGVEKLGASGLVSCVIPTYKRCDMVGRAVESVLAQTYKDVEVLVVDDNDESEYSEELKRKMAKYKDNPRVHLLTQPKHINGAAARNYGIKKAKGEFIAFLDDDDECLPDKIEKQMKHFSNGKIGVVTCYWKAYKNNKEIRKCVAYTADGIQFKILSRAVSIFTSTVVIRKEIIERFGGFDESLMRHQDLQFLADAAGVTSFDVVPEFLVKLHTDSDINRPNLRKLMESKKKFLLCERDTINKYSFVDRRRIYGAHWFEVIYAALKEKKIGTAMFYMFRVCLNVPAVIDVAKRAMNRRGK